MESVSSLLESESEPESDFWFILESESEPESRCTRNRALLVYSVHQKLCMLKGCWGAYYSD